MSWIGSTNQSDYDSLRKDGQLHSTSICRRLKTSWREIVANIELKPARVLLPYDEMLRALKGEFERLGSYKKPIYDEKRNKKVFPHSRTLTQYLDMSWIEITKKCGRIDVPEYIRDNVSDNELIHEYKVLSKQLGKPATVKELKSATAYSFEVYRQHFGTMEDLRKACGFNVKMKGSKQVITITDCERELKAIYKKHGRLSFSELQKVSSISISTIFRKFRTTKINEVWDEIIKK